MDAVKNLVKVTVSTGYDAAVTSVVLAAGHGAKLPNPAVANFNLTWWNFTDYSDPADDPNVEIVRVTALSTDTITVIRGQEGITASTKNTGGKTYKMILGITKKVMDDLVASTETTPMVASQVNNSSVGNTYTDVSGNTYAETVNQTRLTMDNTRTRIIKGTASCHVSAGTGTIQLFNYTDSASLAIATTTSTTEIFIFASSSVLDTNNGDSITLRLQNSNAGATMTIDAGGMIASDYIISPGAVSFVSISNSSLNGYPTSISIALLKAKSVCTITSALAYHVSPQSYSSTISVGVIVNIGATFGTADDGTVLTRNLTLKHYSDTLGILTTAQNTNSAFNIGISFNSKTDNI